MTPVNYVRKHLNHPAPSASLLNVPDVYAVSPFPLFFDLVLNSNLHLVLR